MSGSSVTQWNDKSSNGYNATNGSYTAPTYSASGFNKSYPGIKFNGSSTLLLTKPLLPKPVLSSNGTDTSIFIVMTREGSGHHVAFGLGGPAVDTNYNTYVLRDPWGGQMFVSDIGNLSSGPGGRIAIQFGAVGNIAYSIVRDGSTSTAYSVGTQIGSTTSANTTIPAISQPFCIGGGLSDSGWFNSYIAEVIIYNYAVSMTHRQQIEGYLAWKWGLQAQLPADHKYKSAAP